MHEQNPLEGIIKDLTSLPFLSFLVLAIGDATGIIPPWLSLVILLSLLFGGYYILSAIDRRMGGR